MRAVQERETLKSCQGTNLGVHIQSQGLLWLCVNLLLGKYPLLLLSTIFSGHLEPKPLLPLARAVWPLDVRAERGKAALGRAENSLCQLASWEENMCWF